MAKLEEYWLVVEDSDCTIRDMLLTVRELRDLQVWQHDFPKVKRVQVASNSIYWFFGARFSTQIEHGRY